VQLVITELYKTTNFSFICQIKLLFVQPVLFDGACLPMKTEPHQACCRELQLYFFLTRSLFFPKNNFAKRVLTTHFFKKGG